MTPFGHAVLVTLPGWRSACDLSLPLWGFARRRSRLPRLEAVRAERRCRACEAREHCRRRVVRRLPHPVAGCPNAALLGMR
jgi:hypothetical protein